MVKIDVANVNSSSGLAQLDEHLKHHSYIEGFALSQADLEIFQALQAPQKGGPPNVTRWYTHVKSFSQADLKQLNIHSSAKAPAAKADNADDDLDLFGSDEEEDAEAARVREERLKAYAEKKSKKPELIAKSSIVLDVKPWDDETDMKELEKNVRTIVMDGLVWGASKLVPVGYGINKLQVMCVVEDVKVSVDELVETIQEFDEYVQSVDIAAFNKI